MGSFVVKPLEMASHGYERAGLHLASRYLRLHAINSRPVIQNPAEPRRKGNHLIYPGHLCESFVYVYPTSVKIPTLSYLEQMQFKQLNLKFQALALD